MVPAEDALVPTEELGTTMAHKSYLRGSLAQELKAQGLEPTGGYKFNVV